ncbi:MULTISPECIES: hypothetical protein [Caloramator]|nr:MULTISPECIES: hypothetical protein [Caloramator]
MSVYTNFLIILLFTNKVDKYVYGIVLGTTIILVMGIIDDVKKLRFITKLLIQFSVVLTLLLFDIRIKKIGVTHLIENAILNIDYYGVLLTVLWVISILYIIEFKKNMENIIYGISIFITLILFSVSILFNDYITLIFSITILGSCLSILIYSFRYPDIKFGHTGIQTLGFTISLIPIISINKTNNPFYIIDNAVILAIMFLSILLPVFDREKK